MRIIYFLRTSMFAFLLVQSVNYVYGADSSPKSYQTFLNEYKDLFLNSIQRLHLEGRHEEAIEQQKSKGSMMELDACNVPTEESLVLKGRQEKLIEVIKSKIEDVIKSYEDKKSAPLKCLEEIELITSRKLKFEQDLEATWKENHEPLEKERSGLINARDYIEKRHEDITKASIEGEQNVYILLDDKLWSFEKITKNNQQQYLEVAEKLYDIWQERVLSSSQKINSIRDEFEKKLYDYRTSFAQYNAYLQQKYSLLISQQKTPIEYPHNEIERLEAQIQFVKKNASYLSPKPRPRELIHGLIELSETPGVGITIGILDYFPTNLSFKMNALTSKVINPEFNGSIDPEKEHSLHGICVASIAAPNPETDIDDGVRLEYFDMNSTFRGIPFVFKDTVCQNQQRLDIHVAFLDSLPKFEKGKPYPIELSHIETLNNPKYTQKMTTLWDKPIFKTQARVINMSAGNSTFGSNFSINDPDGGLENFICHRALADLGKLTVTTLGNNGLYLTGSDGLFIKRALAKAKTTRNKIIFVGGLLEDGLNILSYSNQPGDDPDLQERTVFAQAANVPCLFINTNTYGEESGTSFACPEVSRGVAKVLRQYPHLTEEEVSECVRKGATPILLNEEGLPYELEDCDAGTVFSVHPELESAIKRSRAKYGMGRINVSGAKKRAKLIVNEVYKAT